MSADDIQVLVVGGGIAGLSLAVFLRDRGFDPVVVERDEQFDCGDRVVELHPDALRVLHQSGAADQVSGIETAVDTWSLRSCDGTVKRRLEATDAPGLGTVRYSRLRDRLCAALPDESIRMGIALRTLDSSGGSVAAEFTNGVREQFDIVIGADGIGSRTRECLGGGKQTPGGTESYAFALDPAVDLEEISEVWAPDGTVFRVLPIEDRAVGWLTVPRGRLDDDRGDPRTSIGRSIDWLLPEALGPDATQDIWSAPDFHVATTVWGDDRVALLGDAAHAHHRVTGVGSTLAIEDAAVLARLLRELEDDLSTRLAAYADRRRTRIGRLTTGTGPQGPLSNVDHTTWQSAVFDVRSAHLATAFLPSSLETDHGPLVPGGDQKRDREG